MNHTKAFAYFGATPRNVQWSWSARTDDSVVVTLWQNEFQGRPGAMTYSRDDHAGWHDGPGYREFMDNLQWSIDHCNGEVRVIVAVKKHPEAAKIDDCDPKDWSMKVTRLNAETGAFTLQQIKR